MRASESPFQSYKSKRNLSFANLICSSVSGPKALTKNCLRFAILSYSKKLWNVFEISLSLKLGTFIPGSLGTSLTATNMAAAVCCLAFCINNLGTRNPQGESTKFYRLPRHPEVHAAFTLQDSSNHGHKLAFWPYLY